MSALEIIVLAAATFWLFMVWAVLTDKWGDDDNGKVVLWLCLAVTGGPLVGITIVLFRGYLP